MSKNENSTLLYRYLALPLVVVSHMTGPAFAATSLMQNLFSFSPLLLQLASYSVAPLFVAALAYYAACNFFTPAMEPKTPEPSGN